jgi:two-component system, LytTR family, sensor kinase
MTAHEKAAKALEEVEALTGFYIHLAVFAVVMTALTALNALASPIWWVQWPLMGWGAGILLHAALVFGLRSRVIRNWQLRKVRALAAKM